MITVIAAVIGNVNFAIVFKDLKYQFRRTNQVIFESKSYENVREMFLEETGI